MIDEEHLAKLEQWVEGNESVLDPTTTVKIARAWVPVLVQEVRALQAMAVFNQLFKEGSHEGSSSGVRAALPASPAAGGAGEEGGQAGGVGGGDQSLPIHPTPKKRRRTRRSVKAEGQPEARPDTGGVAAESGRDQSVVE